MPGSPGLSSALGSQSVTVPFPEVLNAAPPPRGTLPFTVVNAPPA